MAVYANRERPLDQARFHGHAMGQWVKDPRSAHGWISRCRNAGCPGYLLLRDPAESPLNFSGGADQTKCTGRHV